jgi:hypothetical protein
VLRASPGPTCRSRVRSDLPWFVERVVGRSVCSSSSLCPYIGQASTPVTAIQQVTTGY